MRGIVVNCVARVGSYRSVESEKLSLLLLLLGGLLLEGTADAGTEEADGADVLGQEAVRLLLLLLSGEHAGVLDGSLLLLSGGLTLAQLGVVDGEQHELGHVRLQALSVQLEALLRQVLAAVVDADADGGGIAGVDLSSGELLNRETAAEALLEVVADGLAVHRGAEVAEGAREDRLSLRDARAAAVLLALGLVQAGHDVTLLRAARLEVLALVELGDLIVTLDHCGMELVNDTIKYRNCYFFSRAGPG